MPRILRSLEHAGAGSHRIPGTGVGAGSRPGQYSARWTDGLRDAWLSGEQRRHVSTKDAGARPCPAGAQNSDLTMGCPSWVRPQDREGESGSWY